MVGGSTFDRGGGADRTTGRRVRLRLGGQSSPRGLERTLWSERTARSLSPRCAARPGVAAGVCVGETPRLLPGTRHLSAPKLFHFPRSRFCSHQGGWPHFPFNINFLFSHRTGGVPSGWGDLHSVLEGVGGPAHAGGEPVRWVRCRPAPSLPGRPVLLGSRWTAQPPDVPTPAGGLHAAAGSCMCAAGPAASAGPFLGIAACCRLDSVGAVVGAKRPERGSVLQALRLPLSTGPGLSSLSAVGTEAGGFPPPFYEWRPSGGSVMHLGSRGVYAGGGLCLCPAHPAPAPLRGACTPAPDALTCSCCVSLAPATGRPGVPRPERVLVIQDFLF